MKSDLGELRIYKRKGRNILFIQHDGTWGPGESARRFQSLDEAMEVPAEDEAEILPMTHHYELRTGWEGKWLTPREYRDKR